jgi:hypothetical protein
MAMSAPLAAQQATPAPLAEPATTAAPAPTAEGVKAARMERMTGVWIEGPGYEITYGKDYGECAKRCLDRPRCRMIEYYRPEKKCNLYDAVRPRLKGGSSDVAIKG